MATHIFPQVSKEPNPQESLTDDLDAVSTDLCYIAELAGALSELSEGTLDPNRIEAFARAIALLEQSAQARLEQARRR